MPMEREITCPLEYGMKLFGGKWKPRIICLLSSKGTLRYSDIKRELVNLTDTALASALKELVADGMVIKATFDSPPRAEYSLTDKGESVIPILRMICEWSGQYTEECGCEGETQCSRCRFDSKHRYV